MFCNAVTSVAQVISSLYINPSSFKWKDVYFFHILLFNVKLGYQKNLNGQKSELKRYIKASWQDTRPVGTGV